MGGGGACGQARRAGEGSERVPGQGLMDACGDAKDRSRVQRSACPIPEPASASTKRHPQHPPHIHAAPQGTPWSAEKHGDGRGSWTLSWTRNPMPRTEARNGGCGH